MLSIESSESVPEFTHQTSESPSQHMETSSDRGGELCKEFTRGHGEVYGAGPAVSEAQGLVNPRWDSAAAIGTVQRWGSGKMNDMDAQHLHFQALIRDGRIASIDKVNIEVTESDGERLRTLMKMLGMTLRQEEATGLIQVSDSEHSE